MTDRAEDDIASDSSDDDDRIWTDFPDFATEPGIAFFRQGFFDIHFFASETIAVDEMESFLNRVAKAVLPDREPRDAFKTNFLVLDSLRKRQVFNIATHKRVATVRFVDNYLAYVSDVLGLLIRTHPKSLKSKTQSISLEDVLEHSSIEELVNTMADKRVSDLSYEGFGRISDYFNSQFGVTLVDDETLKHNLIKVIAIRNLLIHRRGIVDSRFKDTLRAEGFDVSNIQIGEVLGSPESRLAMDSVYESALEIEVKIIFKYSLPTKPINPTSWNSEIFTYDEEISTVN